MDEIIDELKEFFKSKPQVLLAFLFGSRAKGIEREGSDWDIGIYFKTIDNEEAEEFEEEIDIWLELIEMLKTDNVDLVVLNRASPVVSYSAMTEGIPLKIEDRGLYLDLLCRVSYDAFDWIEFVEDYYRIMDNSCSISPQDRTRLIRYLKFLESEFNEIGEIKEMSYRDYITDRFIRKVVERWCENIVMAILDIAKILLASERISPPQTYKEILQIFGTIYFNEDFGKKISWFAIMRNIIVHEYLDIKWRRIEKFIYEKEETFPKVIDRTKALLNI